MAGHGGLSASDARAVSSLMSTGAGSGSMPMGSSTRGAVSTTNSMLCGTPVLTTPRGALVETVDAGGAPVCTSWYGTIYRDVAVTGPDRTVEAAPSQVVPREVGRPPISEIPIPVAAGLAHVYTECARIFNPIHTDAAVAQQAGLPAIILHGTATLALAVSKIVAAETGGDPARVSRIAGRFGAMVMMPSQVLLRICAREPARDGDRIFFEVLNDQNHPAIRDGLVVLGPANGDLR